MSENSRQKDNARRILDLINMQSEVYTDLVKSDWHSETQTGEAPYLVEEFREVVSDLLRARLDKANEKLKQYETRSHAVLQPLRAQRPKGLNVTTKVTRVGEHDMLLTTIRPDHTSAAEMLYGLLYNALDDGSFRHLMICVWCNKFYYREHAKGGTCGKKCKSAHHYATRGKTRRLVKKRQKRKTR